MCYLHVWTHVVVGELANVCMGVGQRLNTGVLLNYSSLYYLRQGLDELGAHLYG